MECNVLKCELCFVSAMQEVREVKGRESRNPKPKIFYAGEDDSVDKVDLAAL